MEGQFKILFEKMKNEMQYQNAELKDSITKTIMDKMDEKLIIIREENKNLKMNVEKLEKEITYLKRVERSNNIIVHGLEETEKSSYELVQNLRKIFNQDLKINMNSTTSTKSAAWETKRE